MRLSAAPVGTTKPVTLSAAFTVMAGPPPSHVEFEFQADDESEPAGSAEVDAMVELGLRPERGYPVKLAEADWRKVREPFDLEYDGPVDDLDSSQLEAGQRFDRLDAAVRPGESGRLTLTGAQWAAVMLQLAGWTEIVEFGNDEVELEFRRDTSAYGKVVDRISAQLGGPRRPKLGVR